MSYDMLDRLRRGTLPRDSISDLIEYIRRSKEVDQKVLDLVLREVTPEGNWVTITMPSEERSTRIDLSAELTRLPTQVAELENKMLQTTSEVQDIRNICNKYLKVERREEALRTFGQLIASVEGIREVYAVQKGLDTIFWIFHDNRNRLDVLEDVVDIECKFERLFMGLDFKYRVLPQHQMDPRIASQGDLVYRRQG
jgi:hypothetical protein